MKKTPSQTLDVLGTQTPSLQETIQRFSDLLPKRNSSPEMTSTIPPTPTPSPNLPTKGTYIIAVYGDSMVDTMGENLEYLQASLHKKHPRTKFILYNYGIGSQNVQMGLARFDLSFSYQTRQYPPISLLPADIIVLGSFSYNPFNPYDRNKHWQTLVQLIQKARSKKTDVYLLAEIAPLEKDFGKGANGVNWPEEKAHEQTLHIMEQLENTVGLAKILNVPLINAFEKSKIPGSRFGKSAYVNRDDGIHPSVLGQTFVANLIAQTIKLR
ncbi:MAG TPA: SGNH/GDSL hydrolase family protein [Patescibacteria group bacterium]|nr:SGNH/GDSL hydrolase family protein [Patescibacteria group bacterium]